MRHPRHAGPRAATAESLAYELSRRDIGLLALLLALPIPIFALSGAAIPLPEIVQRVAASLVPGGDDTTAAETAYAPFERGTIRLAADEAAGARVQPVTAAPSPGGTPRAAALRAETPRSARATRQRQFAAGRTSPPGRTRSTVGERRTAPRVAGVSPASDAVEDRVSTASVASTTGSGRDTTGAGTTTPAPMRTPATDPAPPAKEPTRIVDTRPVAVTADGTGVGATVVVPVGGSSATSPTVGVQTSGATPGSPGGRTSVSVDAPLPLLGDVQADGTLPIGLGAPTEPPPAPAQSTPPPPPSPPLRLDLPLLGK